MLIKELVKTCSDPHVARAAVRSLGANFYSRIEEAATKQGVEVGEFVADAVRQFRTYASEADWMELARATAGRDIPILCGLRHILEASLREEAPALVRPAASIAADRRALMAFLCCTAA